MFTIWSPVVILYYTVGKKHIGPNLSRKKERNFRYSLLGVSDVTSGPESSVQEDREDGRDPAEAVQPSDEALLAQEGVHQHRVQVYPLAEHPAVVGHEEVLEYHVEDAAAQLERPNLMQCQERLRIRIFTKETSPLAACALSASGCLCKPITFTLTHSHL